MRRAVHTQTWTRGRSVDARRIGIPLATRALELSGLSYSASRLATAFRTATRTAEVYVVGAGGADEVDEIVEQT